MSEYFLPYRRFGKNINVKVDLSNYAPKTDLKNVTHVDISNFALRSNLDSLKTEVDKLDVDKLVPVTVDLSKLSDVVKNDAVKETKVNNTNTTVFVLKSKYNTDKSDLEKKISDAKKKIPNPSALVKKADYKSTITEIESKIPSISGLDTNAALTAVENKIPDVNSLVIKTDYNPKSVEIESIYITTADYIKFTKDIADNSIKSKNLVTKADFDVKLKILYKKLFQTKQNIYLLKMN